MRKKVKMEEWTKYFKGLSEEAEKRIRGEGRKRGLEMRQSEVSRVVKETMERLKRGKAVGEDGIEGEGLNFGGEVVPEEIC